MPPAALMSAAACSTPFFICAPVAAFGPVIGPPTPNLTCARSLEPSKPECHADQAVDCIIMDGKQCAFEQSEMNESHCHTQHQHINDDLPPGAPGQGHCAAG